MDKIRVWFAGNSAGLKSESHQLVANDAAFEWVGKSNQSTPALARICQAHPDVLVLDVDVCNRRMHTVVRQLLATTPALHIVALDTANKRVVLHLLRNGVQGYISRRKLATKLARAIQAVAQGDVFLCPSASNALLDEYRKHTKSRKTNPN